MSDLSSAVVTEFTSLAGVMARHYALRDGYSEKVAEALFEITLPRFSGDILPKTDAGTVLAIADRLESLVGLFAAGCQPSSTNDPFGLRRISYGLVQLLVETNRNLELRHALELAAAVQPIKVESQTIDTMDKGINPEVVRAVLAERANWPCLATMSAHKMQALSKGELLPKIIEAYSRPTRIVRGKDVTDDSEVDEAAFNTVEERALWSTFTSLRSKIHPDMEVDDFVEASVHLVQPLEDFFNNVFVMVEDERIRTNRLALLRKISDLPKGIVAEALFEITLPRFSGDILPKTDAGTVLAIADRLESLVGLFAAGCQPSSTNDPFGLRRISYGLVQLLVETNRNLELRHALELAAAVQPIKVESQTIDTMDKGINPEVVRAVLAERANWPCLATMSAHKMQALSKGELLPKLSRHILVQLELFVERMSPMIRRWTRQLSNTVEERALWSTFTSLRSKIHPDMEVDDFVEASVHLVQPLEDFFNNVFVMVEDERIRTNRLALLRKISDLPKGIVDLSILPGF
ncbi:glycine--tRNA ligase 2 chloroplastic/mitochondrial [Phtheirospermum japonicum]|uniref:glycine--tRNA ligase n=1 Tax=Phtheirospermum japonicum TaxID=374723 RepID=A0A830C2X3_9LAMI|nr:glycine--tRNA ligase 2 chloroplastic/mitochondrial [Phtheirospermum japonicum]